MKKLITALFVLALGVAFSSTSNAATTAATMSVDAIVPTSCSVSALPISFPDAISGIIEGTSSIDVNCSVDAPYTIALDAGLNYNTDGIPARHVWNGVGGSPNAINTMPYVLCSDSLTCGSYWGDGIASQIGFAKSGAGTGSNQTIPVYGLLTAGGNEAAGAYSDTVTVTVNY